MPSPRFTRDVPRRRRGGPFDAAMPVPDKARAAAEPRIHVFLTERKRLAGSSSHEETGQGHSRLLQLSSWKRRQGKCQKKGGPGLLPLIEEGLQDRGIENVLISSTGCLNACDDGPVMAVFPEGYWYGSVDEDRLEEILDSLESGQPLEDYLLTPVKAH